MGFLTNLFGGEGNSFWTVGFALIIVVLLIIVGVWLLKLIFKASGTVARGRQRRLAIIDSVPIDPKRTIILIRRDNVEHLVIIGATNDLVVESGIAVEADPAPRNPRTKPEKKKKTKDRTEYSSKTTAAASRLGLTGLLRRSNTDDRADPPLAPAEPPQYAAIESELTASKEPAINPAANDQTTLHNAPVDQQNQPDNGRLAQIHALNRPALPKAAAPTLRHTGLLRAVEDIKPDDTEVQNSVQDPQNSASPSADSDNNDAVQSDADARATIEKGTRTNTGGSRNGQNNEPQSDDNSQDVSPSTQEAPASTDDQSSSKSDSSGNTPFVDGDQDRADQNSDGDNADKSDTPADADGEARDGDSDKSDTKRDSAKN